MTEREWTLRARAIVLIALLALSAVAACDDDNNPAAPAKVGR